MKESKSDSWICLVALVIFLYYLLIVGWTLQTPPDTVASMHNAEVLHPEWNNRKMMSISTIIFIGPPIFIMFFFFMLFKDEIRYITIWTLLFSLIVSYKILKNRIRLHFKY